MILNNIILVIKQREFVIMVTWNIKLLKYAYYIIHVFFFFFLMSESNISYAKVVEVENRVRTNALRITVIYSSQSNLITPTSKATVFKTVTCPTFEIISLLALVAGVSAPSKISSVSKTRKLINIRYNNLSRSLCPWTVIRFKTTFLIKVHYFVIRIRRTFEHFPIDSVSYFNALSVRRNQSSMWSSRPFQRVSECRVFVDNKLTRSFVTLSSRRQNMSRRRNRVNS